MTVLSFFLIHSYTVYRQDYSGLLTCSLDIFSQRGKKGLVGSKAKAKGKYKYL